MFTGIITNTTQVITSTPEGDGLVITLAKPRSWNDLELGESVATNGVCLTVATITGNEYTCHLMAETLHKTTFGICLPQMVNLERAMRADTRLGGHFVQGHVDGVGTVKSITTADGTNIAIVFDLKDAPLVVYKGSVAIDGVSLTVSGVEENILTVSLVPYTLSHTTLGKLKEGDSVNLEFDIIGKYIHKSIEGVPAYAKSHTS